MNPDCFEPLSVLQNIPVLLRRFQEYDRWKTAMDHYPDQVIHHVRHSQVILFPGHIESQVRE
jgi:hypothetical protein